MILNSVKKSTEKHSLLPYVYTYLCCQKVIPFFPLLAQKRVKRTGSTPTCYIPPFRGVVSGWEKWEREKGNEKTKIEIRKVLQRYNESYVSLIIRIVGSRVKCSGLNAGWGEVVQRIRTYKLGAC